MQFPMILLLFFWGAAAAAAGASRRNMSTQNVKITSFDGTQLSADAHVPEQTHPSERFPVIIFANSWATMETEYFVDAMELAGQGYLVVEYASRGWPPSTGLVEAAGPQDQHDTSEVISFVLGRPEWHADPRRLALAGLSYGGGLALLGAAHDPRVRAVVSMSGWPNLTEALFENSSPNLVWGTLLIDSGEGTGKLDPELPRLWRQVLQGKERAFREYAEARSVETFAKALEARRVALFLSNNLEDRLFKPQDMLNFFERYGGPKKLLLNQGIHGSAEIGGLLDLPRNYVWLRAMEWLDYWLKGDRTPHPATDALLDVQLRSDMRVRERFAAWPSPQVVEREYVLAPRGDWGLHGSLLPVAAAGPPQNATACEARESITFSRWTGVTAGIPVVGPLLQVYFDFPIVSNLLFASRRHAIWYYAPVSGAMRLCGTPELSIDVTSSSSRWQVVAYLFAVDWLDQGVLISHGSTTCWDCVPAQRTTRKFQLRTLCDDVRGGLGLALNLYSDLYQPANADSSLTVTLHYSPSFKLKVPQLLAGSVPPAAASSFVI